ncbi:MAG: hypothetical protein ACP6IP_01065 [Candidatus Njordarchaeia archaeon]
MSEYESSNDPVGVYSYLVLGLEASHEVLGSTVATMNMMLGKKFYWSLISSGALEPFGGKKLSDLINYLKEVISICRMPVRDINISLTSGLLKLTFYEDVSDRFRVFDPLRKSKGWVYLPSIFTGLAIHLISLMVKRKLKIVTYNLSYSDNRWDYKILLRLSS